MPQSPIHKSLPNKMIGVSIQILFTIPKQMKQLEGQCQSKG